MLRMLIELFIEVDEPSGPIGVAAFVIMAIFGVFATYVWFNHPPVPG